MVEKDEIHLEENEDNLHTRPENIEEIAAGTEMIIQETNFKESPHLNTNIDEASNSKD
jgi:hypothetical protein